MAVLLGLALAFMSVLVGALPAVADVIAPPPTASAYAYDSAAAFAHGTAGGMSLAAVPTHTASGGSRTVRENSDRFRGFGVAAKGAAGPGSAILRYSYPPNRGFLGGPVRTTLKPGTVVDRYGADSGTFVSPQGTSFAERSLPPSSLSKQFNTYEVVNPVEVNGGTVAPWFGHGGGGIQYEFDQSIADLIEGGFLKAVG